INLGSLRLTADRLPQRVAIVQVIAGDHAMLTRRNQSLLRNLRRRLTESAEDASCMKPPSAFFTKYLVPVDLARLQLANRRVSAIRAAQSRPHAKPALGKVQPVARGATNAVILPPDHVRLIDATLVHQVLNQAPHRIVGERRNNRRLHPKTSTQTAADV